MDFVLRKILKDFERNVCNLILFLLVELRTTFVLLYEVCFVLVLYVYVFIFDEDVFIG